MKIMSTYSVRIGRRDRCFDDTVALYRGAVDFFLDVLLAAPESVAECDGEIRNPDSAFVKFSGWAG